MSFSADNVSDHEYTTTDSPSLSYTLISPRLDYVFQSAVRSLNSYIATLSLSPPTIIPIDAYQHFYPRNHYTVIKPRVNRSERRIGIGRRVKVNGRRSGIVLGIDLEQRDYLVYMVLEDQGNFFTICVHKFFWSVIPPIINALETRL